MNYSKLSACSMLATTLLLAACGGGDKVATADTNTNATATPALDDTRVAGFDEKVASVKRNIYTLTEQKGVYGKKLAEDGWLFIPSSLGSIPNTAETIVYINTEAPGIEPKQLSAFFKEFKGTLVLDSDKIFSAAQQTSPIENTKSAFEATVNQAATDKSSMAAVNKFYDALSEGRGLGLIATAMVRKSAEKAVAGVLIDDAGNYNGASWEEFKTVADLAIAAAANIHKATEIANNPSAAPATDFSQFDARAEISQLKDGWFAVGYLYVNAYQDKTGQRYVAARVYAGEGDDFCMVGLRKCGIYPKDALNVVTIKKISDTRIHAIMYGMGYQATLNYNSVDSGNPIIGYGPSAESWNTSDSYQKDYVEQTWSQGYSIGGSLNLQTFIPSLSGSLNRSQSFTKRIDRWDGYADHGVYQTRQQFGSIPAAHGAVAKSGINLRSEYTLEEHGFMGPRANSTAAIDVNEKNLANDIMFYRGQCNRNTYAMGVDKPRLTFAGCRPGVAAEFKSKENLFWDKIVTGGLKWFRSNASYNYSDAWPCTVGSSSSRYAGWLKSYKPYYAGQENGVSKEYWVGVNITIGENFFQ